MTVETGAGDFALLERYVGRHARTIPGYLRSLDLEVICALGRWQSEAGLAGGLAEIGVHHGKLFLALAALRRPAERAIAIDLFEDDTLNSTGRHAGRASALPYHAARLSIPLAPCEIVKADSATLTPEQIRSIAGPVRLGSIDGAHTQPTVGGDLHLMADVLAPHGIIALDDFANDDWPDVREAATDFLATRSGDFQAFLLTPGKLYIAHAAWADRYSDIATGVPGASTLSRVPFLGGTVPCVTLKLAQKLRRFARDLSGVPAQYLHGRASRGAQPSPKLDAA